MEYKVFQRLIDERQRLGLNKTGMAALFGVAQPTYLRYESGLRSPDANALAVAAAGGIDVLYILTGQRSQGVAEVELLPSDERVLVDAYRRCNAQARQTLIQTAALLSAGMGADRAITKPASSKRVAVGGSVSGGAVVVAGSVRGGIGNGSKK